MTAPMVEVSGGVEAPLDAVASLLLEVRQGPVGPDNGWLLTNIGHGETSLTGGPDRFTATAEGHRLTVEVDRGSRTVAVQGGWWYRGEYTLDSHPCGTRLTHRVYNVATRLRWGVPLANRFFIGFDATVHDGFAQLLQRIGERLACPQWPEGRTRGWLRR